MSCLSRRAPLPGALDVWAPLLRFVTPSAFQPVKSTPPRNRSSDTGAGLPHPLRSALAVFTTSTGFSFTAFPKFPSGAAHGVLSFRVSPDPSLRSCYQARSPSVVSRRAPAGSRDLRRALRAQPQGVEESTVTARPQFPATKDSNPSWTFSRDLASVASAWFDPGRTTAVRPPHVSRFSMNTVVTGKTLNGSTRPFKGGADRPEEQTSSSLNIR